MSKKHKKKPYRSPIEDMPPITFDVLVVEWDKRRVTVGGRTIDMSDNETQGLSIPVAGSRYRIIDAEPWEADR